MLSSYFSQVYVEALEGFSVLAELSKNEIILELI